MSPIFPDTVHNKNQSTRLQETAMQPETIKDFDTETLKKLLTYHTKISRELQLEIDIKKDRDDRRKAQNKAMREATDAVKYTIFLMDSAELGYEKSISTAVKKYGVRAEQLKGLLKQKLKENSRWALDARRATIIRLAHAGMMNYEIAAELGLHRNTISTTIRAAINARTKTPPPEK